MARLLSFSFKKLNNKGKEMGSKVNFEVVNLRDLLSKTGMISAGLRAEQKGPAEKDKGGTEDGREEEEGCQRLARERPPPGQHGLLGEEGKGMRAGENTWKLEMARKNVEGAPVRGSWDLFRKRGETRSHLL